MNCEWGTVLAISGINLAIVAIVGAFLVWALNKLDGDIKALSLKVDSDIKGLSSKLDADMKLQTSRTDQLYQMFIDLLKAQNPKSNP